MPGVYTTAAHDSNVKFIHSVITGNDTINNWFWLNTFYLDFLSNIVEQFLHFSVAKKTRIILFFCNFLSIIYRISLHSILDNLYVDLVVFRFSFFFPCFFFFLFLCVSFGSLFCFVYIIHISMSTHLVILHAINLLTKNEKKKSPDVCWCDGSANQNRNSFDRYRFALCALNMIFHIFSSSFWMGKAKHTSYYNQYATNRRWNEPGHSPLKKRKIWIFYSQYFREKLFGRDLLIEDRRTKKSTTYGAIMDPTWLDVLLVPNAEFRILVGNISAVWTATSKYYRHIEIDIQENVEQSIE